jgi:plastocyanin
MLVAWRRALGLALSAATLALVGLALASSAGLAQESAVVTVEVEGFAYHPKTLTVPVGTTVEWVGRDAAPHTVTADDRSFDSGLFGAGERFRWTFTAPGTYGYYCIPHGAPGAGMFGTVVVTAAGGPPATPPATEPPATEPPAAEPPAPAPETAAVAVGIVEPPEVAAWGYDPVEVVVPVGATVTWTNLGIVPHTATAEDGSFDSGILEQGGTFSRVFDAPGEYPYRCTLHPWMVGKVVVSAEAAGAVVVAEALRFQPQTLTVPVGTTVVWMNADAFEHTVTADDGSFDSGLFGTGGTFAWTFSAPGTYGYYCVPHGAPGAGMHGTIVVVGPGGAGEAPAGSEASSAKTEAPPGGDWPAGG